MLDVADVIYMLDNWKDSEGAKIELAYAKCQNKKIIFQPSTKKKVKCTSYDYNFIDKDDVLEVIGECNQGYLLKDNSDGMIIYPEKDFYALECEE